MISCYYYSFSNITRSTTNGPVITRNLATIEQIVSPELLKLVGIIWNKQAKILDRENISNNNLKTLDPHDEPANIADELEDDGQHHHSLVMGTHQEDTNHDW